MRKNNTAIVEMNYHINLLLVAGVIAGMAAGCGQHRPARNQSSVAPLPEDTVQQATPESTGEAEIDWRDTVHICRHWENLRQSDYLFTPPSKIQITNWKNLCEKRNPVSGEVGLPGKYKSANQYITVWDLIELWYGENSCADNLDLTLWRIAQFKGKGSGTHRTEQERFECLRNCIRELDFEPGTQLELNFHDALMADLQAFYCRVMSREAIRKASPKLSSALERENRAWEHYHAEVQSAYEVIDGAPDGMNGSAWPMAISGIGEADALVRETSLSGFYFALTDHLSCTPDDSSISQEEVLQEYARFMDSFREDEFHFPPEDRRQALSKDMDAWKKWMQSRAAVSALLSPSLKKVYDPSTRIVLREKFRMLKNRYQGYGIISGSVIECLIPDSVLDDELRSAPSFDKRWGEMFDCKW